MKTVLAVAATALVIGLGVWWFHTHQQPSPHRVPNPGPPPTMVKG